VGPHCEICASIVPEPFYTKTCGPQYLLLSATPSAPSAQRPGGPITPLYAPSPLFRCPTVLVSSTSPTPDRTPPYWASCPRNLPASASRPGFHRARAPCVYTSCPPSHSSGPWRRWCRTCRPSRLASYRLSCFSTVTHTQIQNSSNRCCGSPHLR